MDPHVSYQLESSIATIALDDGKVNALSPEMLAQINRALDRAERDGAAVVLTGRPGILSAGFDLAVLRGGGAAATAMVQTGFGLAERLLAFPAPVVIACTGHAIAMGLFVVLSGDYRIGAAGPFKLTANEVAIGLTMPQAAIEICRQRLSPSYVHRTLALAEPFAPDDAIAAAILDRVVPAAELAATARGVATQLAALDRIAHRETKLRIRGEMLDALRRSIAGDKLGFRTPA